MYLPSLLIFFFILSILTNPSISTTLDSFIFAGCTLLKYMPGSPYESNLNSLLTSLVNSAMSTSYNNVTVLGSSNKHTIYGLYQCRGDLASNDCASCVTSAVSQLGTVCPGSCGGSLQLEGCFVKYDNVSFVGVEDKRLVVKKCGPSINYDSDALTRRDAVLGYLGTSSGSYRVGGSGNVQGVAQCVGDLSAMECQDCLSEAIGRLRMECGPALWGDMFLAKCYARYSVSGQQPRDGNNAPDLKDNNSNGNGIERTLAIAIGLIVIVALLVFFLSYLSRRCEKRKGCK